VSARSVLRTLRESFAAQLAVGVFVAAVVGVGLGLRESSEPAPPTPGAADEHADGFERRAEARPTPRGAAEDARPRTPRQVFSETCGMCHTLRAAGSTALFGPSLDELRPSAARVRRMLRTGSIDGVMQPNLLRGADADRIARWVAKVTRDG
jgi:mono/diheme cytochrome c family protein